MDFNRPIKIQTGTNTFLDINSLAGVRVGAAPLSGFKVESAAYASVAAQGFIDKAALRDGATVTEAYLGTRTVDILVSVYGETMGDFWDKLDQLTAAMQPMPLDFSADFGVRSLRFFQPSWEMAADFPGGIELDMRCRPAALPTYNVGRRNSIGKESDGFSQPATLRFIAPNPKKFLTTSKSLSTGTAQHRGSAAVYPILSKASCTAGDTVTFSWSGGGTSSIVQATAVETGTISIDTDTMQQTNCRVVHANTSGDFLVYPGTVTIGDTNTSNATLTFTEAWL
jgi:hypothetical protein